MWRTISTSCWYVCSLIINTKDMNGNNFWNWTRPSEWTNGKPHTQLVPLWNEPGCTMEAASANRKSMRVNMKAMVFLKQNCTEDICREEPASKDECIELQIFIALIINILKSLFFFSILAITLYTCMVIMHNAVTSLQHTESQNQKKPKWVGRWRNW